jgi:hypothetical protein
VNIAALMEALAKAGGVAISGTVDNTEKLARFYWVLFYHETAAHRVVKAKKAGRRTWRNAMIVIAIVPDAEPPSPPGTSM